MKTTKKSRISNSNKTESPHPMGATALIIIIFSGALLLFVGMFSNNSVTFTPTFEAKRRVIAHMEPFKLEGTIVENTVKDEGCFTQESHLFLKGPQTICRYLGINFVKTSKPIAALENVNGVFNASGWYINNSPSLVDLFKTHKKGQFNISYSNSQRKLFYLFVASQNGNLSGYGGGSRGISNDGLKAIQEKAELKEGEYLYGIAVTENYSHPPIHTWLLWGMMTLGVAMGMQYIRRLTERANELPLNKQKSSSASIIIFLFVAVIIIILFGALG